jgi:hypothetical protein
MMGGGEEVSWNFGVRPAPDMIVDMIRAKPTLYSAYPNIQGRWDGKTVNHWDAILKNYSGDWTKAEELIQNQPRGSCGGRAGSFTIDAVQHIMIASGKRAKFHRASHAAVYYFARRLNGWIGSGNWKDENNDGVASGSVPKALASIGVTNRDESNDPKWYGQGSDDIACQLVCGMHPALEAKIIELAADNVVTDWSPISSAQELADGIAAGGVGIGSDSRGFSTTRDSEGCCKPSGTWHHYHVRVSVQTLPSGRKVFGYNQSWGKNNPTGPKLVGHPGNCFGVDWDVQDSVIRNGHWAVVFGFPVFELESGAYDIPWKF